MLKSLLITLTILSFLTQIAISFFSSSQILIINQQISEKQKLVSGLQQKNQQLRQQYSQFSSLKYIQEHYNLNKFQPITKQLKL